MLNPLIIAAIRIMQNQSVLPQYNYRRIETLDAAYFERLTFANPYAPTASYLDADNVIVFVILLP